jgi:hypothetical protein
MIEQFEQEYQAVQSEQDNRSMSLNSRAQMIAEKHRLQQIDFEKKEVAKRKLANQMNSLTYNRDEYGINSYAHRNDSLLAS